MKSENQIPVKSSITTKLLRIVFSFYLIIAVSVTLGHMFMEYRYQKESISRDLRDIQRTFESGLSLDMWDMNQESLRSTIEGILKIPVIVGVKIQDKRGHEVAVGGIIAKNDMVGRVGQHVDLMGLDPESFSIQRNTKYDFDVFAHQFPLLYSYGEEIRPLGSATIYSNSSVVFKRVKLGFIMLIINAAVKTAALWLIFLWVSSFLLRKPLTALATATEKVSLDNLDSFEMNVKTFGHNELAMIQTSFNSMIHNLHDSIVEREKTEEALKESEERYRALYTDSRDAIMILTPDMKFIAGNPAVINMFACRDEQDFTSRTAVELSPDYQPDGDISIQKAQEMIHLALERGSHFFEWTHCRTDGTNFPATVLLSRIENSHPQILQGTIRDITEHKQAEEERNRLIAAVEQAAETIVITDSEGMIQYVNPAFEQTTGYTYAEAIGQNPRILKSDKQDGAFYKEMWDTLSAGETWSGRLTNKRKDGSFYTEEAVISPMREDSGKTISYVAVKRDITKEIILEEKLRQAQKMESIGNLAGGIAHDFNNLLYPIIGMSEMLLEDLTPNSLEHENAREIYDAGIRAADLVKQILVFSRQSEHKLIPVRIQNVLNEALKLCRSTIPADIEIHQDIQTDCRPVKADATQIHQVAMNLITNAYHAIEGRNGTITVQLKQVKLTNRDLTDITLEQGHYLLLTVSDTGSGIKSDIVNKIFEPYFTTKEKGKGTGLGLAVVYGIVKEHQGDIKVHSEVNKGTTFNVYLPLSINDTQTAPYDHVPETETGTERILLVDDEKSVVTLEKKMLFRLGYQVTEKTSSQDALDIFIAAPDNFDLIITDMTMPVMTGVQLAKSILSIRPDIPIIICTGFSERINKEKAEAIGVKGFLMKPVKKSEMAQIVRRVLDGDKETPVD